MMLRVRFQGVEYIATNGNLLETPLATPDQFRRGECSFAHVFSDGIVRRFHQEIGKVGDIELLGEIEDLEPEDGAFDAILNHPSWE